MKLNALWVLFALATTVVVSACGPVTYQRQSVVWEPYDAAETRQKKDNVTVDVSFVTELPPSFTVTVAACDQYGRMVVDGNGNPVGESLTLGTDDQVWQKVAVTNDTQNVIRMNGVVIRLFDPAANQYSALTFSDLQAELYSKRPCPSTEQAMNMFKVNPIFDRNMEIVPGTTTTFWVAFKPATVMMPGLWKFALYDVPVAVDPAGNPTRTTRFETRIAVKEVTDTFRRESPMDAPKLVERREVTASGETVVTRPGEPAAAASPAPIASAPPSKEVTAQAQSQLNSLGFDTGKPDGMPGPRTQRAIEQFQESKGLEVTGSLDAATLRALGL